MYELQPTGRDLADGSRAGLAVARDLVITRLARAGMPRPTGELLVDEWLRSTAMLPDFVAAPDYWDVAFRFATDEYRRRRQVG
jgi:hypothetical protein